jgi:type I restriction enzyme R subunit
MAGQSRRRNRTAEAKSYGLVVDHWGVSQSLQEALAIFSPSDIRGALEPKQDELPRLQARHAAAMRFFNSVRNKDDLEQCVAVLAPEDVRAEFQVSFRRFSQSMDMLLPDPRALEYGHDLGWLGKFRQAAKGRYRDDSLDISDCGDKVRRLIEEAVIADGVQVLVKEVSLFSGDFDEKVKALQSDDARASEMEHAIRHEIHVRLEEDPAYYQSLRERLLDAAHEIKERRDQVRRPHYAAPELLATRPNEVWSWDISKLLGPAKWTYFYLYVILDIFSRYVVGWMLATHESAALAERLIAESCAKHGSSRAN